MFLIVAETNFFFKKQGCFSIISDVIEKESVMTSLISPIIPTGPTSERSCEHDALERCRPEEKLFVLVQH